MILAILNILACLVLAGAAICWEVKFRAAEGAHKFLFPFIIATVASGALVFGVRLIDLYEIFYGGTSYVMGYSVSGYYIDARWVNLTEFFLLMLPGFGLFPPVGRRPWLMIILALLSISPAVISPLMFL